MSAKAKQEGRVRRPRKTAQRRSVGTVVAVLIVVLGIGVALVGCPSHGLRSFTPLAQAVVDLHVFPARHLVVAAYGNDLPGTNGVAVSTSGPGLPSIRS